MTRSDSTHPRARTRHRSRLLVAAVIVVVAAGCGSGDRTVDVFAAASLTNAFEDLAAAFETGHPDVEVRLNLAGTSTLREQLRNGAEADVFASANDDIMQDLVAEGIISASPTRFASNVLVLAEPVKGSAGIAGIRDLERDELFIGVCSPGVPCGDLAAELAESAGIRLAADTEEPDVRSLARRLATGELDVALVYRTDVVADPDLQEIVIKDLQLPQTAYPIAPVGRSSEEAAAFVEFVLGEEGRAILQRWGFELP